MRLFFTLSLCALVFSMQAKDIYVSPVGSEGADGSIDNPYPTIQEAQLAARVYAGRDGVNIWLDDGIYYLDAPIVFTQEDGGSEEFPVTYRALHEGKAIISGGRHLELQWSPYQEGIFVCEVPGGLVIDQLFMNAQRQEMARFPNSTPGKNVFDCWTLSHSARADSEMDPLNKERISTWKDPEGAYLHAMHRGPLGRYALPGEGKERKW